MFVESIKKVLNRATVVLVAPLRMSRLTARIMAIMVFPLSIFLVGLLSIDQYRTTLIQSEFIALERQGFTLARSLALAEADRDQQFARRVIISGNNDAFIAAGWAGQLVAGAGVPTKWIAACRHRAARPVAYTG